MSLPKMLQYRTVKPKGFPSEFKRFEVLPQSVSMNYNLNDIVRFTFKTDWFFDPFQTYMDIEVEFPQDDQNMGVALSATQAANVKTGSVNGIGKIKLNDLPVYSLDGPATSLIEEMILYSNGVEVERVQNYDVVGNILADIGVPALSRQNKKFEGYGFPGLYNNLQLQQLNKQSRQIPSAATSTNVFKSSQNFLTNQSFCNIFTSDPAITDASNQKQLSGFKDYNTYDIELIESTTQGPGINYFKNFAREYVLCDGSYGVDHMKTANSNPFYININDDTTATDYLEVDNTTYYNLANLQQYKRNMFNYDSSNNHFDYICPGIQAQKWYNGSAVQDTVRGATEIYSDKSKQSKYGVYKKTFHIPILSGVMGHLIPTDQWKLIPGAGCGEMTWEFRINKYAFFASGHLDNDSTLTTEPTKQFNINWKVTKVSLRFDLWRFDQSTTNQINQQISSGDGVMLSSQGFAMGPVQQIATTSSVRNVYQINNGILSLKNVYIFFLLNDYMKYNFCRKHYRISQNIKSLQLKLGNDFIPKQPILGNAGKITSPLTNDDVYPFLLELYRSQGEMFSTYNNCTISPFSFMVNDRAYDPANKQHTKNQTALLQEQRCSGKAIYTIDTTADPFDQSVLTGLDTTKVRPIELLIDNDQTSIQSRSSTMYVLLHHDTIVQFTAKGIITTAYS